MSTFRLPRKTKKKLKGKFWLYPPDEKRNRTLAFPAKYQKDYDALKTGIVEDLLKSRNRKADKRAYREKMNKEISVSDAELKVFVSDIIAPRFSNSSYNVLIKAKAHPRAVIAYYNFLNAYFLHQNGEEGFSNVCCMAVDEASLLLRNSRKKR